MKPKDLLVCSVVLVLMVGVYVGAPWLERLMQEPKEEEVGEEDIQFEKVVPIPLEGAGMSSWTVSGAGDESYNGVYEEAGTYNGKPYYQKGEGESARYLYWIPDIGSNTLRWVLGPALDEYNWWYGCGYEGSYPDLPANPWSATAGPAPAPTVEEVEGTPPLPPPPLQHQPRGWQSLHRRPEGDWAPGCISTVVYSNEILYHCTHGGRLHRWMDGAWQQLANGPEKQNYVRGYALDDGRLCFISWNQETGFEDQHPRAAVYDPQTDEWITYDCPGVWPWADHLVSAPHPDGRILTVWDVPLQGPALAAFFDPATGDWGDVFNVPGAISAAVSPVRTERGWLADLDGVTLHLCCIAQNKWELYRLNADNTWTKIEGPAQPARPSSNGGWDWLDRSAWTCYGALTSPRRVYVAWMDRPYWQDTVECRRMPGQSPQRIDSGCSMSVSDPVYAVDDMWIWKLERGPWMEHLSATSYGTDVQVYWDYTDAEALDQNGYQVQLLSEGTVLYDSEFQAGRGTWYRFHDVAPGDYTVRVQVWNSDGLGSDTWDTEVTVAGEDEPLPPPSDLICTILQPSDQSHVSGESLYLLVAVSGGTKPYTVQAFIDSYQVGTLNVPNYGQQYRFGPVDTTKYNDGTHTIRAEAHDGLTAIDSDSITVYVANGSAPPPEAEDNPPEVHITAPPDNMTVAGIVPVHVTAEDDRGLRILRLYVHGGLVQEWSVSGTETIKTYQLDTRDWSNGWHNITAWVWDTAGNAAYSAINLAFANGLADTTKVLFTTPLALTRTPVLGMLAVHLDDPPEDPRYRYNVYGGYVINSDSADFGAYTRVPLNRSHAVPAEATTIKWALQAVPQIQVGYWDLAAEAVRSLFVVGRDLYAITWPPAVYRLAGADWVLVVAEDLLPTETYASCAYADGKVYIATDQRLIAMDLDAGDATVLLGMPVQVRVLAAESSGSLLCWGADALWRFTWPSTKRLGTAAYPVWTMTPGLGGTYLMGTTDGKVVSGTPGSWTEAVLPGAGAIWWLGQLGTTWYAAGAGGIWQYTGSAWVRELEAEGCHRAVATAMGYGWAVGQGEYLWRRGTTAWAAANALEGMVDGYCLLERNGVLYIGGTGGTESPTARVWVYRVDEGGTPSGPEPPDVMGKILREVDG